MLYKYCGIVFSIPEYLYILGGHHHNCCCYSATLLWFYSRDGNLQLHRFVLIDNCLLQVWGIAEIIFSLFLFSTAFIFRCGAGVAPVNGSCTGCGRRCFTPSCAKMPPGLIDTVWEKLPPEWTSELCPMRNLEPKSKPCLLIVPMAVETSLQCVSFFPLAEIWNDSVKAWETRWDSLSTTCLPLQLALQRGLRRAGSSPWSSCRWLLFWPSLRRFSETQVALFFFSCLLLLSLFYNSQMTKFRFRVAFFFGRFLDSLLGSFSTTHFSFHFFLPSCSPDYAWFFWKLYCGLQLEVNSCQCCSS